VKLAKKNELERVAAQVKLLKAETAMMRRNFERSTAADMK
jgi:hypothetical protein